jgi:hypothetical protein
LGRSLSRRVFRIDAQRHRPGLVRGAGYEKAGMLGDLAAAELIQHIGARPQVSLKELAQKHGLPV